MGNRATIEVKDTQGYSAECYVYIHWHGDPDSVVDVVRNTAHNMRKMNASYAIARLIGAYHEEIDGGLSLGVTKYKEEWDNGHYIVDMADGTIENEGKVIFCNIEFGDF
jgi:hypothetical protein